MSLTNEDLKRVLYEAMVRYYFRSESFSFKLSDDDGMQGFLLAAPLSERDHSQAWLKKALAPFTCEEQDLVYNYLRYLSYNGQRVRALSKPEDLLLCLFLSRKSGVGSRLLQKVEEAMPPAARHILRLQSVNLPLELPAASIPAACKYHY